MVSAHWYVPETAVTANERPRTIHDFGGFPRPLHEIEYPAPGAPWLADRVAALLAPVPVRAAQDWGLDHGTWSVLMHAFPDADVPVVQLSIDRTKAGTFHYELGRRLAPLRDEGVLIAGSGDVVHNLGLVQRGAGVTPYDWGVRFHDRVKAAICRRDHKSLLELESLGEDARLSNPTPEHYLPLLYVLGAQQEDDGVEFFNDAVDLASISMLGVRIGTGKPI